MYNLLLALFFLSLVRYGDYLDDNPMSGYTCPTYCEVNHNHYRGNDEDTNEKEDTEEANEQGFPVCDPGLENASRQSADSTECADRGI